MIVYEHTKLPFVSLNIIRAASLERTWRGVVGCDGTVAGETRFLGPLRTSLPSSSSGLVVRFFSPKMFLLAEKMSRA